MPDITGAVLIGVVLAKLAATRRPVWVAALVASVFFSCTFSYLEPLTKPS